MSGLAHFLKGIDDALFRRDRERLDLTVDDHTEALKPVFSDTSEPINFSTYPTNSS